MDAPTSFVPGSTVLRALARRVRLLREARHWSREELSRRSGVSVRFLARIESGDGNISVVRLAALAAALDIPPDRLLRPAPPDHPIVALTGLRGAGKSTVGPLLATRLGLPFVEMDTLIRQAAGLPLDQIFELHGERYYRRLESETLERVLGEARPVVIATAGGVVNESSTWDRLCEETRVVWMRASPEDHWNRVVAQGDRRPMADNPAAMDQLRDMLRAREGAYSRAWLTVETSGKSPQDVTAEIARAVQAPATARRA